MRERCFTRKRRAAHVKQGCCLIEAEPYLCLLHSPLWPNDSTVAPGDNRRSAGDRLQYLAHKAGPLDVASRPVCHSLFSLRHVLGSRHASSHPGARIDRWKPAVRICSSRPTPAECGHGHTFDHFV
ncbi:hypothetical protein K437DRAFT_252889 [Tilletiaria anomala UBC 951]|uniref:Uncharacterized protein n=1 Tax=Tilletiaria anomala (strain ATCC 24038 / CBS 436.72 / UBC 951) TaxID=1037660 RepID=A0A066WHP6_TILAU|nr:uncharacterized protein K437DRAFT_252889 [Tilletiaria anomala UBC 951]KDN53527.1 hypothetical protein K437DRAFT_252889 [Tilletiaria anomala UBC 951]